MASSSPTSPQAPMTISATKSSPIEFRGIPRQKLHSSTKKVESTGTGRFRHKHCPPTTTLYILNDCIFDLKLIHFAGWASFFFYYFLFFVFLILFSPTPNPLAFTPTFLLLLFSSPYSQPSSLREKGPSLR